MKLAAFVLLLIGAAGAITALFEPATWWYLLAFIAGFTGLFIACVHAFTNKESK
ncbi:hypothetical protein [Gryllotalpicola koreensis]|uniref:Uncharacterized protein n=1 Tax=Gryllotalpicola koreensis TaxID=993086 RepID=A0ABP8A2U7_9MICO